MSKLTVRYKIKAKKRKPQKKPDTPAPVEKPSTRPVSRAARMLALAYYVERLVDQGAVKSYADAARELGVSRARMSQILTSRTCLPAFRKGCCSATCTSASGGGGRWQRGWSGKGSPSRSSRLVHAVSVTLS